MKKDQFAWFRSIDIGNKAWKRGKSKGYGKRRKVCRTEKNYWQRDITYKEWGCGAGIGIFGIGIVAYLFYQSWMAFMLLCPAVIFWMIFWKRRCIEKKKELFRLQFKEALGDMTAALRAGYSMENAMRETERELRKTYKKGDKIIREFDFMNHQLGMNIPVEKVWQQMAQRTSIEETEQFASVLEIGKRTGGNLIKIMQNTAEQITEKTDVIREIKTIMTEKQYEFRVMSLIPFGIMFYMKVAFPEFMVALYKNPAGITVMTICLVIYLAAFRMGQNIINIEV